MNPEEPLIVSISGVRGIVGGSLDAASVLRFCQSLAATLEPGPITLSADSRPSGRWLTRLASSAFESCGRTVIDLGVIPTPTTGVAVQRLGASGGLHVTASHNPAPYNGLKLFGPDGRVLPAGPAGKVRDAFISDRRFRSAAWNGGGQVRTCDKAQEWHAEAVLEAARQDGLLEPVQARGFRVLVDGNGGAGGPLAWLLLERLGVEVVPWQCEPDGHFAHPPEPTGDNLASLGPIVRNARVDLAFVLDPDADRLALLDAEGQFPSEEYTLALAADGLLARRPGPLVINLSTSRLSEWVAKARGCPCIRTPVGEAHVVDGMLAHQAVLGGEGNGGVMDPRVGWVRDPFVGMALILGGLALSGNTLRQAISSFPKLTIIKDKTPLVRKNLPAWMDALKNKWPGWLKDERDGLRLECDAGWIQVRASNTEPIARIIAESANIDNAPAWIREAVALMPPG